MREPLTPPAETDGAGEAAMARTEPATPAIHCRGLWKAFGAHAARIIEAGGDGSAIERLQAAGVIPAVCDVDFDVAAGEIFVIMGLSGSGKSTLVRCLSRLIEPTAGRIEIEGTDLLAMRERELRALRRQKIGMVFQNFGLMPYLTVIENVAFPLRVQGIGFEERMERAARMVELVGLESREWSLPSELSGGQQQRVGIARSLAVDPQIWLLDEPFSALDPLIRRQMQDEFLRLQRLLNKTIVFVTHDFLEAVRVADRIAIMRAGQIVQIDRPSRIVLEPADDYVAEFIQDIPIARVVSIGEIAEPLTAEARSDWPLRADTSVEHALQQLSDAGGPRTVIDATGETIGQITLQRALDVLKRGSMNNPRDD